jgi:Protein of unknown function (DUF4230)
MSLAAPGRERWFAFCAVAGVVLVLGVAGGFALGRAHGPESTEALTSRPTPNVVLAVRDLARLEATSFHMEKVIELTDEQSRLFGLVTAKDQILLVAVGDVVAGVDLSKLGDSDVEVDPSGGVRVALPPPEILSTTIDEARTHVYGRTTDLLAARKDELEGLARKEAAEQIEKGARDAGILDRARMSTAQTVRALLQSLGFRQIVVGWRGSG